MGLVHSVPDSPVNNANVVGQYSASGYGRRDSAPPWIVFNMMYNYQQIKGSVCTGFTGLVTGADGEQKCAWSSTWKMDPDSNPDTVKGYSFVGLTQNLENKISDIASIPSTYHWVRSNTTNYKGTSSLPAAPSWSCIG